MPTLPTPLFLVVLALGVWAVSAMIHRAKITAPVRYVGVWSEGLPRWLRWAFLPFQAAAVCQTCLSWWVAAGFLAATLLCQPAASWWSLAAQPNWVAAAFLLPALVGAATLIQGVYAALPVNNTPARAPEDVFAELAREQERNAQHARFVAELMSKESVDREVNAIMAREGKPGTGRREAPPPPPPAMPVV